MTAAVPSSRAERRRATERRIIDCARELFAERGYDRTTIRAVAAAAGVDPSLVMQYFGTKRDLFTCAARVSVDSLSAASPEQVAEQLLATLGMKLDGSAESVLVMLRSMLTSPEAAEHARDTLGGQIRDIAGALPGTAANAELRAALMLTTMIGVTIGSRLLELAALREVPPDTIADALRPALRALGEAPPGWSPGR
ncbi:TetR/AcrR family transcriptional regulator [Embleya sp. AB8]|uniref:TetR/AcrR family transcriptional regulator n=1 Tax=Embleya sp. AB8 TaxID=3156304 RepID=UPI003C78827A